MREKIGWFLVIMDPLMESIDRTAQGVELLAAAVDALAVSPKKRPPTRRAKNLASAVRENIKSLQQKRVAEVTKVQTWK